MRLLLAEDELDLSRALVRILKANHYEVDLSMTAGTPWTTWKPASTTGPSWMS